MPGSLPGASREPFGSLPGASREPPRIRSARFLIHAEDLQRIWSVPGTSRSVFGDPAGPSRVSKIDQKSILGPKRGARNRFFIDFSREHGFYRFRAWFFINFLLKLQSKNQRIFSKLRAFFSTRRLPKSMHRCSVLSTFCIFHFFWELLKNDAEN